MKSGKVYLVGAGPGDEGLLTVKASKLIQSADVIVYDYLVNEKLLSDCRNDCEKIYVGKEPHFHAKSQEEIEAILVKKAKQGMLVVRLKGGDPFIFGRGGEEATTLAKDKIDFEIVPGITAAIAAAAYAGIPLTHRDFSSSVCFLTGHENPDKHEFRVKFKTFAETGGTLCIYMGIGKIEPICQKLIDGGLPAKTPAAVVQWATLPTQKCVFSNLAKISSVVNHDGITSPAIIFVGEAAKKKKQLHWFDSKPLFGNRIVVTRRNEQSGELTKLLENNGAEVLELPLIKITKSCDAGIADEVFKEIGSYEWLIFTSTNGVKYFFDVFLEKFKDIRSIGFLKIAVIGASTGSELRKFHIWPDLVPKESSADALGKALIERESIDNIKILVITGNQNRDTLIKKLHDERAIVDTLQVYKTEKTDLKNHPAAKKFREEGADAITFASSSAVKSFIDQAASLQMNKEATKPKCFSIGKQTSDTMRKANIPIEAEAKKATLDALVSSLIENL